MDDEVQDAPDDVCSVVVTAVAVAAPEDGWRVLVEDTPAWWSSPYLGPDEGVMHLEPRLGGTVWAADPAVEPDEEAEDDVVDLTPVGALHGTVRAWDPPERLEIGGVLVPGAYAGTIAFTRAETALGTEVRVEHVTRGRVDAKVEEAMTTGWAELLARLTALADGTI